MTALPRKPASAVVEADSVLFQMYSCGDMQSSGAARNSGMEFVHSVMAQTKIGADTGKSQWDDRTRNVADQDVQGEPFNQHSWSDGKKMVSIYIELDD